MEKYSPKKILFLSSWYPNRNAPTFGIFVKRHAQAVAIHNQVCVLYVCFDPFLRQSQEIIQTEEEGIKTIIVYCRKIDLNIPLLSGMLKLYKYLKAYRIGYGIIMKSFGKPDINHVNMLFPVGVIGLLLKRKYGIPFIVTENWTGYLPSDGNYKGVLRKLITKSIANNAGFLTPVSLDLQQAMKSHGFKNNYEIVPNVVDVSLFYPEKNKPERTKKRLIHVSALDDPQKNISGMIRAVKKVSEKRNDLEFFIVGDGEYRQKLELLADQLGLLNTTIFFTGLKLKEELATFLRQCDFFILFSNYENLPCVVLESIASGIPVIVSRIGGTPEHISSKMGIIVEPKDEAGLEKAIEHMLDNYSTYDTEYMRQYAIKKFSYESVAEQFNIIYDKVI
jgi:glycosyltransferase involved in cell wall biosynthesis